MDVTSFQSVISLNDGDEMDTLKVISDTAYWNDQFPILVTGAYSNIDSVRNVRILKIDQFGDCVLKDSLFEISDPKSNCILIYAQPYNHYFGMKYFVDAEWKIKSNRIYIWRKTKTTFDKEVYLRKKKINCPHELLARKK